MRSSTVALFVGLILGLAYILTDFGEMLVVAAFGVVAFVIGKVIEGEIDLSGYIGGGRRQ